MKFVIWKDSKGEWRWTLWARNGKKIGACGEGYKRRYQVLRMCARINPTIRVQEQA